MREEYAIVNPNNKIGIKTLTNKQLQIGLPAYDALSDKIEDIRSKVSAVNRESISKEIFESLKYDQIFSLIGGRGAGKTSILLTLYNIFKSDDSNIVLPIIMPELIDDNESIVSWLISAMGKNLEMIEKKIKDFGQNNKTEKYNSICDNYKLFDRCLFNKNNLIHQKFDELKSSYYSKEVKTFDANYPESREYKAISEESSFLLMQKFVDYWNTLIDVYSNYLSENKNDKNPLVFIFIDDADLKPQIINELLFVIPKYLSHPNIVVFISAAHKTLTYAVKNYMYKSLVQTPFNLPKFMEVEYLYNGNEYKKNDGNITKYHDLKYGKEYDKIKRLSDEILRKLFPVYNRYYLKKYDRYEDKKLLQMFETEDSNCQESIPLSKKIVRLISDFCGKIINLHKNHRVKANEKIKPSNDTLATKIKNFHLIEGYDNNKQFVDMENYYYLSFLGQYPRDIVAVYYALKDMLDNLQKKLSDLYIDKTYYEKAEDQDDIPFVFLQDVYEIIVKFLSSAITSNRKLSVFSKYIRDLVKAKHLHWQLFVDYAKVIEIFKDPKYYKDNKRDIDAFVEMITLLNFVEQFIVLIMPQRRRSNGYREFINLMNLSDIKMIRCDCDLDLMLRQYYKYHELGIIPNFNIESSEHQANFLFGLKELYKDNAFGIQSNENDNNRYKKYPLEWYEFVAQIVVKKFFYVGKLKDYKEELKIIKTHKFLGDEYNNFYKSYYENLKEIFFQENNDDIFQLNSSIVYNMEKDIVTLSEIIEKVELGLRSDNYNLKDNIDIFGNQLDYIENMRLKKEVASLIAYIYSNTVVKRNVVISKMNTIKLLIEADEEDYMTLSAWYVGFGNLLDDVLEIKNIPNSRKYLQLLGKIKREYVGYIKYYYMLSKDSIKEQINNIEKYYYDYTLLGEEFNTLIQIAKEREWSSFIEME